MYAKNTIQMLFPEIFWFIPMLQLRIVKLDIMCM